MGWQFTKRKQRSGGNSTGMPAVETDRRPLPIYLAERQFLIPWRTVRERATWLAKVQAADREHGVLALFEISDQYRRAESEEARIQQARRMDENTSRTFRIMAELAFDFTQWSRKDRQWIDEHVNTVADYIRLFLTVHTFSRGERASAARTATFSAD